MKIIHTDKLDPLDLNQIEREWVYNGLDACVTWEVLETLLPKLNKYTSRTYNFSRELQGAILRMRLRGVKVDEEQREAIIEDYENRITKLEVNLERIVREGCGIQGFSWTSLPDLRYLFYNVMRIPQSRTTKGGQQVMDAKALDQMEQYVIAEPIVRHMKRIRELKKRLDVLQQKLDTDGRFRTSYNIAGTTTGRLASSLSEFGTGGNAQNIEEFLRSMFIADDGMKMANFDAEQGESRIVGAIEWCLFHDGKYLDVCESEDIHTIVCRSAWPHVPWTGDLSRDRPIAEKIREGRHNIRFLSKRLGHGSNYGGLVDTLAAESGATKKSVQDFQRHYFKAFPSHHMWHQWVRERIRFQGYLITLTGRQRHFWGRRDSDDTIREAIAYDPQGSLSDVVNQALIRVCKADICELLMQCHDSIVVQYPQEMEDEIIPKIMSLLDHRIKLKYDRTLTIPFGCKTGWNWGEFNAESNRNGLKKYSPGDQRRRES